MLESLRVTWMQAAHACPVIMPATTANAGMPPVEKGRLSAKLALLFIERSTGQALFRTELHSAGLSALSSPPRGTPKRSSSFKVTPKKFALLSVCWIHRLATQEVMFGHEENEIE